jgi:hypothetical protein
MSTTNLTAAHLLEALRSATEEERTEFLGLLGVAASKKGAAAATKPARARKAASAAPLPEPDEDGAPSADAYRLKEEDIDHAVCVGRILKGGKDRRWSPAVYREFQCSKATEEDCDLCKICQARLEKFAEDPKSGGDWNGRVTEEPHAGVHMLGTEWAEARKPKWLGEGAAASSASDTGSDVSAAASSAASKKEAKEAEKKTKAEEKEKAKAKKEEEKKAKAEEKEKAKKEKEAAKQKAKEEKEAKKAAAPPKKAPAPAVKKAAGGAGATAPAAAPVKADTSAAVEEVEMDLKLIDGTIYAVKGEKVYEYDEDAEEAGDYVGHLTADETIDKTIAEDA